MKSTTSPCATEAMKLFSENNDIYKLAHDKCLDYKTLNAQLNPRNDKKYDYLHAVEDAKSTGDHVLLKAFASELGYGLFKVPQGSVGDEEMLDLILGLQEISGRFANVFNAARADGIIEQSEYDELKVILNEKLNAIVTLRAEIKAQVREVK